MVEITLNTNLDLARCPHCAIAKPNLYKIHAFETSSFKGVKRYWHLYICSSCGGPITAGSIMGNLKIKEIYPNPETVDESLPSPARDYLQQALESIHAPSGAIMLCASAVDSMLKIKGYKEGNLFSRINKAASDHLITEEMSKWAHEVRLDANEQRHADDNGLPNEIDAKKTIDFALALAVFLFVLPARIENGLSPANK